MTDLEELIVRLARHYRDRAMAPSTEAYNAMADEEVRLIEEVIHRAAELEAVDDG